MNSILVHLPDAQIEALAAIVALEQRPRADVIREAIASYIRQHRPLHRVDVFGLWKSKNIDGLK